MTCAFSSLFTSTPLLIELKKTPGPQRHPGSAKESCGAFRDLGRKIKFWALPRTPAVSGLLWTYVKVRARSYSLSIVGSTLMEGPIVVVRVTVLKYRPFTGAGRARCSSSRRAKKFSTRLFTSNDFL